MERNSEPAHRRYDKIDIETRRLLVHEVMVEERSISKTAKKLGVKLSTAKVIIKRYKEEGTFFQTKKDKQQRIQNEERQQNQLLNSEQRRKHQITTNINIEFPFVGFTAWNGPLPNFQPFVFYEGSPFPLPRNIWFSELN